ncbi:ABC transporter transmembrane domain-containing protein [Halobacteriovorax sp. DPLXC-1]|uniref:ABC transporter transmembrane domain-containing protein n=1 Tax=Halobacteriovorax sp. DPLXC-1 TaxID=3110771 RepID=UPI002FF099B0
MELNQSTSSIGHLPSSAFKWIGQNAQVFNKEFISLRMLLALSFIINITSLALPIVLMQVYDRIIPNHSTGTAIVLLSGLAVFILFETGLKYLRYYMITFAGARYENRKSHELIRKTVTDSDFYNVGVFQYTLKEIQKNKAFFAGQGIITLTELPFLFLYLGFLFYLNPLMALVPVVTLTIYMMISLYSLKSMTRAIQLKHVSEIEQNNLLFKILDNLSIIRKFGRINLFNHRFKKSQAELVNNNYNLNRYEHFQFNLSQLTSQVTSVIILAIGAYLVTHGQMGIGALAAAIILANRCVAPTGKIFQALKKIHEVKVMSDVIIHPESAVDYKEKKKIDKVYSVIVPIYIEGRRYEIPFMKGDTVSLENQDEDTKEFLSPTNLKAITKKIFVNDFHLDNADELSVYKKIAVINSVPSIWNGTVRENVTSFGLISDEKVQNYIDLLGLGKIIRKLPQGMETYITSENDDNVSNEVKTLIYITRKLALDPEIIVLNEFESNLDRESYAKIYEYISSIRESKIILINTNDQNLLKLCNRDLLNNRIGEIDNYLS